MANTDNKCKDLEVKDVYSEMGYDKGNSSLEDLYNLQKKTQEMYIDSQGRKRFEDFTIGDVIDFLLLNEHAAIDEMHEMIDAVGGIDDGVGNAAWKPWKKANKEIRQKRISDLSDGDLKELKMEYIDLMHFIFNMGIAIGVTPKEFYNYYLSKNAENWRREESKTY